MEPTDKERLAVLETKVAAIETDQKEIIGKLDVLIGLKQKGIGAFLVVSALTGTGIITGVTQFLEWLKGAH